MRRGFIVLLAGLLIALGSQAQITISPQEVPHTVGQQFRYYAQSDSIWVNIGNPGGPQTWNFTTGDTSFIATDQYLDPQQSPPQYSHANVVIQTDQLNMFGFTDPGVLYCWLGAPRFIVGAMTTTYQGTPVGITFTPYITQYPLPLYMGRTWSNPINVDQQFSYGGSNYRLVLNATINSSVDAYGTVQVPLGSYETLRIKNIVNYNATIYIWLLFVWVPIYEESGSAYSYDWRAENVGTVLSINTSSSASGYTYINGMRRLMGTGMLTSSEAPVATMPVSTPESYAVLSSYPNPFNAQTTIAYNLPEAAQVDLRIFDLVGQRVAMLDQGYQESGTHEIRWVPENLASGLYFVHLRAGQHVQRHMMIYLK